jgi:hypothetical protein
MRFIPMLATVSTHLKSAGELTAQPAREELSSGPQPESNRSIATVRFGCATVTFTAPSDPCKTQNIPATDVDGLARRVQLSSRCK